ncbi:MAG: UDP-N-acetylmuramyl tripeptide synthase [Patescibacteria group bacterium]|nr:UDP-N-acetylmuramyl tripeptide synthase [Patescibacteria group bacterium]
MVAGGRDRTYNGGMSVLLTLAITKTAARLSRVLGRGGGQALPGLMAERLDPHLARKLAAGLPHGVIVVTGTNGKTTTTKLIAAALEAGGERVLTNSTGSNLKRGVTSALIAAADGRGRLGDYTIGLFEVDEASLRQVAPELLPEHIVVLNLFRDQLDRYGELDTTAALIGQGIAATKARLYLNADDPLVASLAKYAAAPELVNYFGVEGLPVAGKTAHQTATDSDRCPVCRTRLVFSRVFYGHIGHYRCPKGHFARPQPSVAITSVEEAGLGGARFTVAVSGKRSEVKFPLPGTYNLYNALAAMSLAHGLGLEQAKVARTLERTEAAFGRVEQVEIEGRTLCLLLIKNPAGFAQVLDTFLIGRKDLKVLFAINDLDADGRDVSWLWDVPLEALETSGPTVLATGVRATDMAVRLHYAGMEARVVEEFEAALAELLQATPQGETAYILPTYTAMLAIRKLLARKAKMQEVWK